MLGKVKDMNYRNYDYYKWNLWNGNSTKLK